MPLDLLKLEASEAERIAYSEGFTMAAELFARIAELEAERDQLAEELEIHWPAGTMKTDPPKPTKNFSLTVSPDWRATIPPQTFRATMTNS
jgi:hypothetical protein